jgi:hypothetical protein
LADEYGLPHAEARRIAGGISDVLRHAHKTTTVRGYQIAKLRPLFAEAAKAKEGPMEEVKPEGFDLSFLAQKTGMVAETIKTLLHRNPQLQDMPYSIKAAGARVFFAPFVEWLAVHQGAEAVKDSKVSKPETFESRPAKLPAGIQLKEMRLIYGATEAAKRLDMLLGYSKPVLQIEGHAASSSDARFGFAALDAIAAGLPSDTIVKAARAGAAATEAVIRRELAKAQADSIQERLGL